MARAARQPSVPTRAVTHCVPNLQFDLLALNRDHACPKLDTFIGAVSGKMRLKQQPKHAWPRPTNEHGVGMLNQPLPLPVSSAAQEEATNLL